MAFSQIGGVRSDLVGDHTIFDVLLVRQTKMFFRRDITQHGTTVPADHGRADGAGDVIVAGRDVGGERPEHVEGRLRAGLPLLLHVHLDLVHRHVARALDHHLHVVLPGRLGEVAQDLELGELRRVRGVGEAARPQAVAEREADVVPLEDLAERVEVGEPRVLLARGHHPLRHQRPAARDDAGDAVLRERQELAQDAGVDGHVIHALLRLLLDDVEQVLRGQLLDALDPLDRFVHRDGAERHGAAAQKHAADVRDVAARRQVHHRVGAVLEAAVELLDLARHLAEHGAVSDVRVDLAPRLDADAHRHELRVHDVRRDDHPAPRDLAAHQLRAQPLDLCNMLHLLRHGAGPREVHLGQVLRSTAALDPGCAHDLGSSLPEVKERGT